MGSPYSGLAGFYGAGVMMSPIQTGTACECHLAHCTSCETIECDSDVGATLCMSSFELASLLRFRLASLPAPLGTPAVSSGKHLRYVFRYVQQSQTRSPDESVQAISRSSTTQARKDEALCNALTYFEKAHSEAANKPAYSRKKDILNLSIMRHDAV